MARMTLAPGVRHAQIARFMSERVFGETFTTSINDSTAILKEIMEAAESGDKAMSSQLLAAQAIALDSLFTELVRRSAANMGEYPDAADRYMRLALRAQSNTRTTIEALTKLHQPREQIVKHVHVNDGGKAVVADQFHNHRGEGVGNDQKTNQSHATAAASESTPLLGQDEEGTGVPIASRERPEKVPNARRDKSGGAQGES